MKKPKYLGVKLTTGQAERLRTLVDATGLTQSGVVCALIEGARLETVVKAPTLTLAGMRSGAVKVAEPTGAASGAIN